MQILLDCRGWRGVSMCGMRGHRLQLLLVGAGLLLTVFLVWFAIASYRNALPVAQTLQRGGALSLGQAIEEIASRDRSFVSLASFQARELAFFALIDRNGTIRFHSNPDLIGEKVADHRYRTVFERSVPVENRIRLGTGEEVYENDQAIHLPGETLALRLALHTWQADQIVRQARTGMILLLVLTSAAWGLSLFSYRLLRRDAVHREAMARREHLAQLGEFGAILAHEVRTPLAGIKGFAQLLAERTDNQRSRQCTDAILRETIRLEALVNDLLIYARPDSQLPGLAELDISIAEAWEMLSVEAEKSGVTFDVSGERGLWVGCAAERMVQLLRNLFANALQAMPGGGSLQVNTASRDGRIVISVADTGPGFAKELLARAVAPFVTTKVSGSGLGLTVCHRIVEGYGGSISLENRPAGGALVTVQLPGCGHTAKE